eukprot:4010796-Heterocapsa_arctica.AAC.1
MKDIIEEHYVIGKLQMKQAAAVAMQVNNDSLRQLGVLKAQQNPDTEFGIRAAMKFSVQKAFARMDYGRIYAADMLRKVKTINKVMCRVVQGIRDPGPECAVPAR